MYFSACWLLAVRILCWTLSILGHVSLQGGSTSSRSSGSNKPKLCTAFACCSWKLRARRVQVHTRAQVLPTFFFPYAEAPAVGMCGAGRGQGKQYAAAGITRKWQELVDQPLESSCAGRGTVAETRVCGRVLTVRWYAAAGLGCSSLGRGSDSAAVRTRVRAAGQARGER